MWVVGDAYEAFMGRWSRPVAEVFVGGLAVPVRRRWLDVGCGTGALTDAILVAADPTEVTGVDPSGTFVVRAATTVTDPRARFERADASSLPYTDGRFDAAVSGLVLNFVPEPEKAIRELVRVTVPGGTVAGYVWDYPNMAMLRYFWEAATSVDTEAADLNEMSKYPLCSADQLAKLWTVGGLEDVTVEPLEILTVFRSFDDYWTPFLGGQGPGPAYVATLADDQRSALRDLLHERLPSQPDGTIGLTARAWTVRGQRRANI